MAGPGWWGFRYLEVIQAGIWDTTDPFSISLGTSPPGGTCSAIVRFESEIWIIPDDTSVATLTPIADLVPTFQITSVEKTLFPSIQLDIPDMLAQGGDNSGGGTARLTSWNSNISGWNSTFPTLANLNDVLRENEISLSAAWDGVSGGAFVQLYLIPQADTAFPLPPVAPPQVVYLYGRYDETAGPTPTPGALTPTITQVGPGIYQIAIVPGINTTVVTIETNGTVITIPVGNFPINVTTPGPTITLRPINTNPGVVPGPEITVILSPEIVMSGGIDLGGTPTLQFVGDPSGIYTLTPGVYRDVLYERIPAPATNPVKIPRPFIKGPFVGE